MTVIGEAARTMTVEEYLAFEEASEIKHEYIDGEILSNGRRDGKPFYNYHQHYSLRWVPRLQGTACRIHSSEMRVRVSPARYVYPDVSVVCGGAETADKATNLLNPTLVVEVTSALVD